MCWCNKMYYFFSRCPILFGPVYRLFARLEFQSEGAVGNKAHVHFLLWLEGDGEAHNQARICNIFTEAFGRKYNTHPEQLRTLGLIETEEDYAKMCDLFMELQYHHCTTHCRVSGEIFFIMFGAGTTCVRFR